MDRFDLHWPKTEACFLTDGRRCRIVWRSAGGRGPAGSIDNNILCKRRVANSLALAPGLLGELKSKGYPTLAEEIEALAGGSAEDQRSQVTRWLDGLPGGAEWQAAGARRGKLWLDLPGQDGEELALRVPASRRTEWVLRRTSRSSPGKPSFVVAAHLRGILAHLVGQDREGVHRLVDEVMSACAQLDHPEAKAARESWPSS